MSHCKKIIMALFLIKCSGLAAAEDMSELDRMRAELLGLERVNAELLYVERVNCGYYNTFENDTIFSTAAQENRAWLDEIHRILDQVDSEVKGTQQAVQQRGVTAGRIEEKAFSLNREAELFRERAQRLAQEIRGEATFLGFLRWACCSCCSRAEEDNR